MKRSIRSDALAPGGAISRRYTCDADDVSPPLAGRQSHRPAGGVL
jgi:hypothetical protein